MRFIKVDRVKHGCGPAWARSCTLDKRTIRICQSKLAADTEITNRTTLDLCIIKQWRTLVVQFNQSATERTWTNRLTIHKRKKRSKNVRVIYNPLVNITLLYFKVSSLDVIWFKTTYANHIKFPSKIEADDFPSTVFKSNFHNSEKSHYQAIKIKKIETTLNYLVITAASISSRSRAFDGSATKNLTSN